MEPLTDKRDPMIVTRNLFDDWKQQHEEWDGVSDLIREAGYGTPPIQTPPIAAPQTPSTGYPAHGCTSHNQSL